MGSVRKLWFGVSGSLAWRLPAWSRRLLTSFSMAERGSYYDMLAAAELTDRGELRRKYLEHALDEARHAGLFSRRAREQGPRSRTQAILDDSSFLAARGIIGEQFLFERMSELEFLAFVHVVEDDAVEQFGVYLDRDLLDPDTRNMLLDILRDEHFHVSYSRAALGLYEEGGQAEEVQRSLKMVRWKRFWEGWLRLSHVIGFTMSGLWLSVLYFLSVGPFALLTRLEQGGWVKPLPERRSLAAFARSQA